MAQKRMFDKAIVDTDKFMDLPVSAKAMYFLLGMDADDEGFVSSRKVLRVHGGNEDDVKVLCAKNFVIPFRGGVVVITDWHTNNYLDKNRLKPSQYREELKKLSLTKEGKYELNKGLTGVQPEESSVVQSRGEQNSTEEKGATSNEVIKEGTKALKDKWRLSV